MKKTFRIFSILLALLTLSTMLITPASAYAAPTVAVQPNSSTVTPDATVVITVRYTVSDTDIGALLGYLEYDETVFEPVAGSSAGEIQFGTGGAGGKITVQYDADGASKKTVSGTVTFKAKKVGSAVFGIVTNELYNFNIEPLTLPAKKTATVNVQNVQLSSNNNLKSVSISLGGTSGKATITPAFSSAVTSYTVTVPNDTSSVSIEAIPAEAGKATAKLEGSWAAPASGNWTRKVIVTAQNGNKKTYTFKIVKSGAVTPPVDDKPQTPDVNEDLRVIVNKKEYSIVTNISNVKAPAGFKTDITKYNEVEIPCFVSNDKSCTLVALSDGDKTDLFIYDAEHIAFDNCDIAEVAGQFVIFDAADFTDEVKDFPTKEVIIGNKTVTTYRFANSGEFVLVWAIGADGEGKLYIYDTVGKTLQRYAKIHNSLSGESDAPILTPPVNDGPQENVIDMQIILLAFGIAGAIILILLVAWIAALVRLKRACPPKNKDVAFVPFFDDDGTLTEFDTSFAYENAEADEQETETPAENEETEEETEENE